MDAIATIADITSKLRGMPAFLAGSLVAEETYGKIDAHDDADVFTPNRSALIASTQLLLGQGFTLDERYSRVWDRWLKWDLGNWHTNSIKLQSPLGYELNMVYKTLGKKPVNTLSQVLESFDFGLLATGYTLDDGVRRDQRAFLFPGMDVDGPLPLMPNKRDDWLAGFISEYNGLREGGRYAKYFMYGYDIAAVKADLLEGYANASSYNIERGGEQREKLAEIYDVMATYIYNDDVVKLAAAGKKIPQLDSLDSIMEALE